MWLENSLGFVEGRKSHRCHKGAWEPIGDGGAGYARRNTGELIELMVDESTSPEKTGWITGAS